MKFNFNYLHFMAKEITIRELMENACYSKFKRLELKQVKFKTKQTTRKVILFTQQLMLNDIKFTHVKTVIKFNSDKKKNEK